MKKCILFVLLLGLCLSLWGCPEDSAEPPKAKDVHITAGKIEPGMTAKDIFVEVTIDNQPVPCRVTLTGYAWDGYWDMEDDEPVPEDFYVCLNVFYSVPKGYEVEALNITVDADGGKYDGTGCISVDAEGNDEAWSRVFYGEEPMPEDTEPTTTEPPTTTESPTTTEPPTTTQAPTTQAHVHNWESGTTAPSYVNCTQDTLITYACTCGQTKTELITAPGHDFGDKTVEPATCTYAGRETWHCKRCGAGYINELPATGHTWSEWTKKTGRVHAHICTVCGAEEEADHNIPSGSVTCTDCGADIIN